MSDTREKRTRQLTIKGQTMFDEQQEQLRERGENIWIKIEDLMITVPSCHNVVKSYKGKCKYHNYI
jgi:hypothetical protein